MNWKIIERLVSGCIVLIIIYFGFVFAYKIYNEPFVSILAARHDPNALLVYDQFVVTQTLHFDEGAVVNEIIVPLYVTTQKSSEPIIISLRRGATLLYRWRYVAPEAAEAGTVIEAHLELSPPHLLDTDIEISFATPTVHADRREQALAVLVETADANYPNGNYRIAANEKAGDIGLTLVRQVSGWEYAMRQWRSNYWDVIIKIGLLVCALWLLMTLPSILARNVARTN